MLLLWCGVLVPWSLLNWCLRRRWRCGAWRRWLLRWLWLQRLRLLRRLRLRLVIWLLMLLLR